MMMPHDAGKELMLICHPDRAADYTQMDRRDKGMVARFFGLFDPHFAGWRKAVI
jgi:hypothetical protein